MLGVRHFVGTAIDLWCGDPDAFEAEIRLTAWRPGENIAGKHVVITLESSVGIGTLFATIKSDLENTQHRPRRVTIQTASLDLYKELQDGLFLAFPELHDD